MRGVSVWCKALEPRYQERIKTGPLGDCCGRSMAYDSTICADLFYLRNRPESTVCANYRQPNARS